MSSGPRTVTDASMYETGAASKAGYTNRNDGATLLCGHIFRGLFRLSPLSTDFSSYSTRHAIDGTTGMARGLFLDLAYRLFFGGGRSGRGELPEDNSLSAAASLSSGRIGSLPLFCLTGGAGWLLPRAFSTRSSSR